VHHDLDFQRGTPLWKVLQTVSRVLAVVGKLLFAEVEHGHAVVG
jgi:hypothetical protein